MTFCYELNGRVFEWRAPMGRAPQALLINGQRAERSIRAEHGDQRSGDPWTNHESLALSVHPLDVPKYRRDAHKRGLNVTIRDDGIFHFDSHGDARKYNKAYGYVNYGDYY